jgi:hypothetical protein
MKPIHRIQFFIDDDFSLCYVCLHLHQGSEYGTWRIWESTVEGGSTEEVYAWYPSTGVRLRVVR